MPPYLKESKEVQSDLDTVRDAVRGKQMHRANAMGALLGKIHQSHVDARVPVGSGILQQFVQAPKQRNLAVQSMRRRKTSAPRCRTGVA